MTDQAPSRVAARLALCFRQRQFEWELARTQQTRAAQQFVSGKTHDMMNLVQIVKLAVHQLHKHTAPEAQEFLVDLERAADGAQVQLTELMAVARPDDSVLRGAPVGPCVDAAVATLRDSLTLQVHLASPADTATRCTAAELEHILIGLALDLVDYPGSPIFHESALAAAGVTVSAVHGLVELSVRERTIGGKPWIEIMRSSDQSPPGDRFELRAVEAIASHAGGELSMSERRGGGEEVVVALPVVA